MTRDKSDFFRSGDKYDTYIYRIAVLYFGADGSILVESTATSEFRESWFAVAL